MVIYIIAGGPFAGKTTIINELAKRGYNTINESAREVITREQSKGSDVLPWRNIEKFQRKVLETQLEKESNLDPNETYFLDSGIPGALVYFELAKIKPLQELIEASEKSYKYKAVFFLDQLPKYKTDKERKEDLEEAKKIHKRMEEVYRGYGYNMIIIPVMPLEKRLEFILSKIE